MAVYKEICFYFVNIVSKEKLSNDGDFIISITSYPPRIDKIYIVIESLFKQTIKPGRIHLWLSSSEILSEDLPGSIKRLIKRGLKVSFVEENVRSYKKLVYALEEYPSFVIITVDDDVIYPDFWFEEICNSHRKNPLDIICYRGHNILLDKQGELYLYRDMLNGNNDSDLPSYSLMPTGVSGILYPPHSLHEMARDKEKYMRLAPYGDDIWFKCCSLKNNRKTKRVFNHNLHFLVIPGTKKYALNKMNVLSGLNDKQMKDVYNEFRDVFSLLENGD